jgi:hypothetical protein
MSGELFFYSLAGLGGGLVLFVLGIVWFRRRMLIENTPTSKIRSLAMGLVEIYGKVVPAKQLLKGPFSGDDCVYYKYTIEEYRHQGKNSRWVTVKQGEERTGFYLRDETGQVLVDPKGAGIEISKDYEFGSGSGKDPPAQVMQFLDTSGMKHEGFFGFNKEMRFTEYHIAPGDSLYVMGTAGDNPFVEEGSAKEHVEDVMIQKGSFDKFYFISDKPEKEILSSLRWKSMAGVFGGIALVAGCLAIIFLYTGLL